LKLVMATTSRIVYPHYYENKTEIEAELGNEDEAAEDFERRKAELLAKRASG